MGRPRKDAAPADIADKLRIHQDYRQYIVIMDVSEIVPYSAFRALDQVFGKIGLVIKRQFGFLGYTWGYGTISEIREGNNTPIQSAPVSLHIYFQHEIDKEFLAESAEGFGKIYDYIRREWAIYSGTDAA